MNHPKIPPNCKHFKEKNGHINFEIVLNDEETLWFRMCETAACISSTIMPIIACVAEVAWRKESERIRHIHVNETSGFTCEHCDAISNAELWRKWGEA
jgi:hypothetical protein